MITEKEYVKIIPLSHRKKFAQFFTPQLISDFMANWVNNNHKGKIDILDPSIGLGVLCRSLHKVNPQAKIVGFEIDEKIYSYVRQNFETIGGDICIKNEDYILSSWDQKYDGIICNPPYLKFHNYDNENLISLINQKLNIKLNGFTNLYTLFLLKSINQLKKGARMAYIVPSEFLNSDYGVAVKQALIKSNVLRHVIIVDFNQCAFDGVLTTACILLCEKDSNTKYIRFSNIRDINNLYTSLSEYKTYLSSQLNPDVKWKQYYDDTQSTKYKDLVPLSLFAKVSRGIATGANDYFTFKTSKIDTYNLPDNAFLPCICHSADITNLIFTENDFHNLKHQDKTVFIFNGCDNDMNPYIRKYINLGEKNGIHKKFLTSSRTPWYAIENRKPSPIWVSVFNRKGLRFVMNKANVYNLTTFHCLYDSGNIDINILFAYLITDIAKEILKDNCRQYGNGLIKFEPNDLNRGNVFDLRKLTEEENSFVLKASDVLHKYPHLNTQIIAILDVFFRERISNGVPNPSFYHDKIRKLISANPIIKEIKFKEERIKQLNFMDLFNQYEFEPIAHNESVCEDDIVEYHTPQYFETKSIIMNQNLIICNVKKDNWKDFIDGSAKIYYTGKRFPTTISLNKLCYFIPYLPGKGIRDLYYIKLVRLGYRKEGQDNEDKTDLRLIFEIKRTSQLFEDYRKVKLDIWRTFTYTTIGDLLRSMRTNGDNK